MKAMLKQFNNFKINLLWKYSARGTHKKYDKAGQPDAKNKKENNTTQKNSKNNGKIKREPMQKSTDSRTGDI